MHAVSWKTSGRLQEDFRKTSGRLQEDFSQEDFRNISGRLRDDFRVISSKVVS